MDVIQYSSFLLYLSMVYNQGNRCWNIIDHLFFFITYRIAFISKNWLKYVLTALLIITSIAMTSYLGYVYFAFFVAYLIGGISNRIAFFTFYVIHLIFSTVAINVNFIIQDPLFMEQLPFIILIWISVILLPFNIYNRKKRENLEEQSGILQINEFLI